MFNRLTGIFTSDKNVHSRDRDGIRRLLSLYLCYLRCAQNQEIIGRSFSTFLKYIVNQFQLLMILKSKDFNACICRGCRLTSFFWLFYFGTICSEKKLFRISPFNNIGPRGEAQQKRKTLFIMHSNSLKQCSVDTLQMFQQWSNSIDMVQYTQFYEHCFPS